MKNSDSRVGILAFLGTTALVLVALIAFARYPSLFRGGDEYRAVFRSVPGLSLGDEVRFGGLLVGSITAMDLDRRDPTRIVVGFRVRPTTPMRADTRASITQVGFLGEPYLNLNPGRPDAPAIRPGSMIGSEETLTFQDAMSRLAIFLERADTLFTGAERLVATSPFDRLSQTLSRADTLFVSANAGTARVFARMDSVTSQLAVVLGRTDRLVSSLDSTVQGARPELALTQREARETLHDMRQLVGELRDAVDRGERVDAIVKNLAVASDNLARLSDRIERDPTSVLRRPRAPVKPAGPSPRG
ncbi:MAG: MlaD family protein [Gemmatimonadaceae bacterium]